jgi:peroxiredoxin/YHS domain-containing protein
MKRRITAWLVVAILASATTVPAVIAGEASGGKSNAARKAKSEGVCLVCKVLHGEAEPEAVVAVRTYEGVEYGFCSKKCAQAFDADPAAFVPPVFPREAPRFDLAPLAGGERLSNARLEGQVVLLDFWATWCKPCTKSMPALQALHDKYAAKGFRVVGISIDEGGPEKVKKFVAKHAIGYPIAVDSERSPAWEAFRVKAVPAAFLLDRKGEIVAQWTGAAIDEAELERALAGLLQAD